MQNVWAIRGYHPRRGFDPRRIYEPLYVGGVPFLYGVFGAVLKEDAAARDAPRAAVMDAAALNPSLRF